MEKLKVAALRAAVAQMGASALEHDQKADDAMSVVREHEDKSDELKRHASVIEAMIFQEIASASSTDEILKREVQHIDAPAQDDNSSPQMVWLPAAELSTQQKLMASDFNEGTDHYQLQEVMLTPDQRARYVAPTSNADDFGGLPG